ncbi:MAG: right-handed parallel beta-helix repeat-containing protein [Fibromonadaceae bacterium]|jgi:parallel beta-helix repeat protein|nr:right-handed parallel beta-helix repeat-containing protein [Fibromonadaceae bacterium]
MKFSFQILSLLAMLALSAYAEDVCGMIDVPITWTKEKSPYRITGDIQIAPASRLTIEAGVEVLIVPGEACGETKQLDWADSTFISIKAYGSLVIKGTDKEPVRILPEKHTPGKIQWDGIRLPLKNKEAVSIEYLHIMGAHKAINASYSIFNVGSSLFMGNNTGIWLEEEGDLAIYNCMFTENLSSGIYISNSRPTIAANIFYKNSTFGILSDSRKSPRIQSNLFFANSDTDCRYCPAGTAKIVKEENGAFKDKFENIFSDPIFVGSDKEKIMMKKDINLPTPKENIKDTSLQKIYETSTGKPQQADNPSPNMPFILSKYSPALNAAPNTDFFKDADGSKGDIGIYGGKPGRTSKSISL